MLQERPVVDYGIALSFPEVVHHRFEIRTFMDLGAIVVVAFDISGHR